VVYERTGAIQDSYFGLAYPIGWPAISGRLQSIYFIINELRPGKQVAKLWRCGHPKVIVPSRSPLNYRVLRPVSPHP
jgi:hypothetical protein